MRALSKFKVKLEQQGHKPLMFLLLLMILVNPFVNNLAGLSWILGMILILVLLAAVRTVASLVAMYIGHSATNKNPRDSGSM